MKNDKNFWMYSFIFILIILLGFFAIKLLANRVNDADVRCIEFGDNYEYFEERNIELCCNTNIEESWGFNSSFRMNYPIKCYWLNPAISE